MFREKLSLLWSRMSTSLSFGSGLVLQVIERYELPVRLTANQNLILLDVEPAWKTDIATTLGVCTCMPPYLGSLLAVVIMLVSPPHSHAPKHAAHSSLLCMKARQQPPNVPMHSREV